METASGELNVFQQPPPNFSFTSQSCLGVSNVHKHFIMYVISYNKYGNKSENKSQVRYEGIPLDNQRYKPDYYKLHMYSEISYST